MNKVIELYDITIVQGHRTVKEQQRLYAQGRTKPGLIVTQIDGILKKGAHNYLPSRAVDIAPYSRDAQGPDWDNEEAFIYLAGIVKGMAGCLGINIRWGGDWDRDNVILEDQAFDDMPHFEVIG